MDTVKKIIFIVCAVILAVLNICLLIDILRPITDKNNQDIVISTNDELVFHLRYNKNLTMMWASIYLDEDCTELVNIGVQNACKEEDYFVPGQDDSPGEDNELTNWFIYEQQEDLSFKRIEDFSVFYVVIDNVIHKVEFTNTLGLKRTFGHTLPGVFSKYCKEKGTNEKQSIKFTMTDVKSLLGKIDFLNLSNHCKLLVKENNTWKECSNYTFSIAVDLYKSNSSYIYGFDKEFYGDYKIPNLPPDIDTSVAGKPGINGGFAGGGVGGGGGSSW